MKRKNWIKTLLIGLSLLIATGLSACGFADFDPFGQGSSSSGHTHSVFDSTWRTDDETHWQLCRCGEKVNLGSHEFDAEEKCTTCRKVSPRVAGFEFELVRNSYYRITDTTNREFWNPVIPSEYRGLPVKEIGQYAFSSKNVQSVVIPEGIETIGSDAFSHNPLLEEVVLPASLTFLRSEAFENCTALSSVTFADGIELEEIGARVFAKTAISSLEIPNSVTTIGGAAFSETLFEEFTMPSQITTVAYELFENCASLKKVSLHGGVTRLGSECFAGTHEDLVVEYEGTLNDWASITFDYADSNPLGFGATLKIDDQVVTGGALSVEKISDWAFYNYDELTSITLQNSVREVGEGAFYNCNNLTTFSIQEGLEKLGDGALYDCDGLERLHFPASLASFGTDAIASLDGILEYSVATGNTCFSAIDGNLYSADGKKFLTYAKAKEERAFTMPLGVEEITFGVLETERQLESLELEFVGEKLDGTGNVLLGYMFGAETKEEHANCVPATLKTVVVRKGAIGEDAFYSLSQITSISFGDITAVEECAFNGCTGITQLTFPKSVQRMAHGALFGISYLEELTIPFIGVKRETENSDVQYPFGKIFGFGSYENCQSIEQYYINKNKVGYGDKEFDDFSLPKSLKKVTVTDGEILFGSFYGASGLTQIVVPENTTKFGDYAFKGCSSITAFDIPETVTYMGESVFSACTALTEIDVPEGCHSIPAYCFSGCTSLEEFEIKPTVVSVGENAFRNCAKLKGVQLPSGLTTLGGGAFYGCTFKEMDIPANITTLGTGIFTNSSLEKLTIPFLAYVETSEYYRTLEYLGMPACLKEITVLRGKIVDGTFRGYTNLEKVNILAQTDSIGANAFEGCSALIEVNLPSTILSIGENAFYGCTNLPEISFSSSKIAFGIDAFERCTALQKVVVSNSQNWFNYTFEKDVWEDAVYSNPLFYAKALYEGDNVVKDITMPEGVKKIVPYAFLNCQTLERVILAEDVEDIDLTSFNGCTALKFNEYGNLQYFGSATKSYLALMGRVDNQETKATIHTNTKIIGRVFDTKEFTVLDIPSVTAWCAFDQLYKFNPLSTIHTLYENGNYFETLYITDATEEIVKNAFNGCTSIKKVVFASSIKEIGKDAFIGCTAVETVEVPTVDIWLGIDFANAQANPMNAFENGARLYAQGAQLSVLATDKEIKPFAFYNCKTLFSIELTAGVIGEGAFAYSGVNQAALYQQVSFAKDAFKGVGAVAVSTTSVVDWNTNSFANGEANPLCGGGLLWIGGEEKKTIDLREVQNLTQYVFYGSGTEKTEGEWDLLTIGAYAFANCRKLVFPWSSVGYTELCFIGAHAFENCTSMVELKFLGEEMEIMEYAFQGCTALEKFVGGEADFIGAGAFKGCNSLTIAVLRPSMVQMGYYRAEGPHRDFVEVPVDDTGEEYAKLLTGELVEYEWDLSTYHT